MEIWLSVVTAELVGWAGRVRSLIGRVAAVTNKRTDGLKQVLQDRREEIDWRELTFGMTM